MGSNKISKANHTAVEVCISSEAGAAVRSMDPMKNEKKEKAFFNKYMGILDKIEDDQFENNSVHEALRRCYKKQSSITMPPGFGRSMNPTLLSFVILRRSFLVSAACRSCRAGPISSGTRKCLLSRSFG
jgi:hypothetical protein